MIGIWGLGVKDKVKHCAENAIYFSIYLFFFGGGAWGLGRSVGSILGQRKRKINFVKNR